MSNPFSTTSASAPSTTLFLRTFLQLKQACQHASGIATPISGSSWGTVVNGALQRLASMRPWSWRETDLSLNTTSGVNYIDLPADFAELVTLHRVNAWRACLPISRSRLLQLRAQSTSADYGINGFFYCIQGKPQGGVTSAAQYRLQLYPTPNATESGALIGTYRRLIPMMSGDTDIPDMPAGPWHEALDSLVRRLAQAREDEADSVFKILFDELYPSLEQADGGVQQNLGYIEGGIQVDAPNDWVYPTSISP